MGGGDGYRGAQCKLHNAGAKLTFGEIQRERKTSADLERTGVVHYAAGEHSSQNLCPADLVKRT